MHITFIQIASAMWLLSWVITTSAEPTMIRFVDKTLQTLVPVRVELLNHNGQSIHATNALPISRDCALAPLPAWLAQPAPRFIHNPFTGTEQHYVNGVGEYELPTGQYRLRAFRGPEYKVFERDLEITQGSQALYVEMDPWVDPTQTGWLSADTHLHLSRLGAESDPSLAAWLAAENLQIANLLQMGALTHFAASPQYAFGDKGATTANGTLLLAGQEHPRTHLLGHSIALAASEPVDERANYIVYDATFAKVRAAGGISGFAHWGAGPSADGMAINAPLGNVELLEVLSFEILYVATWYQWLNAGFAITAIAGTDFPCLPSIPGRERTYINIGGYLDRDGIVAALRAGRTLVSNGPFLTFHINNEGIGGTLDLSAPEDVRITGQVTFDPGQDAMQVLELIHNGEVIRSWPLTPTGRFEFHESIRVDQPGWFALRAIGHKLEETKPRPESFPAWMQAGFENWMSGGSSTEIGTLMQERQQRASFAHTSPIYIALGSARSATQETDIRSLLERLDGLESLFATESFRDRLIWDWLPYSDGVSARHIMENRALLLEQIKQARSRLAKQLPRE